MTLKYCIFSFLVFTQSSIIFSAEKETLIECQSSKEFITTLNFLKSKKQFGIEEKDANIIAKKVSTGCTGAANRFIQVFTFLTDAEIPSTEALNVAKKYSGESEQTVSNFSTIFKKMYVDHYFDLPEKKSLSIAQDLTIDMDKDAKIVFDDFNILGDFCLQRNGLDLNHEKCANFIQTVLKKSKNIKNTIGKKAIEFYDFLVLNEKGPKLNSLVALKHVEDVSEFGNVGFENFIEGYIFASSEQGLNQKTPEAISLALELSKNSIKKKQ